MRKLLLILLIAMPAAGCAGADRDKDEAFAARHDPIAAQKACKKQGKQAQLSPMAEDHGQHFAVYSGYRCFGPGDEGYKPQAAPSN